MSDDLLRKTLIQVPVFNRERIAVESLRNLRAVKGAAHLRVVDDHSTECDGRRLVALGDSGEVNAANIGINALRVQMLMDFLGSEFEYCYFTDSDTLHDPAFLARAFALFRRTETLCGLYNSSTPKHRDGMNLDLGDEIILRRTIPGVSMFFDRALALRIANFYGEASRFRPETIVAEEWDWYFCSVVPHVAMSRTSYVEHLYYDGLHGYRQDFAVDPTPFLVEAKRQVLARLNIPDYPAKNTVIYMPVFNRKAITLECLRNMREVKGEAHLHVIDDHSTEFDGHDMITLGDSGSVNPNNMGINAVRVKTLLDFLRSDYEYCYFTDSDTLHDPNFLHRAFFMFHHTQTLCGLYNTSTPYHKEGVNLRVGGDIVIRRSIPGVSMFFNRDLAKRIADFYKEAAKFFPETLEVYEWDWYFCSMFPHVAMSETSYIEHLYFDGLHGNAAKDRAVNPTAYLVETRAQVLERLGIVEE